MEASIATEVHGFVVKNFLFGCDDHFGDDDSFLEMGIIDSTGILELVSHLEQTYGVEIAEDELIPDNLDSINQIACYLSRKLDGRASETGVRMVSAY